MRGLLGLSRGFMKYYQRPSNKRGGGSTKKGRGQINDDVFYEQSQIRYY